MLQKAEGFEDSETRGGCAPLNPLGNSIVACYALERRYDVVLEPTVTVFDKSFNIDVALKMDDKTLMLLEVKLHRKDVGL